MVHYLSRMPTSSLTPMLTVRNAADAIHFYERAFRAVESERVETPTGQIVAEMSIDGQHFFIVDENPKTLNLSPESLGGTSVRINLIVDDTDATIAQAIAAGATEIFPAADQPYGLRQGRVSDAYRHHWLIGTPLKP
jgi:PhnB protein